MKYLIWLFFLVTCFETIAQQKKTFVKDTSGIKRFKMVNPLLNKYKADAQLKQTIETELINIVGRYVNEPNTQATWIKIKLAADDLLFRYYTSGQLIGLKKEEAYFTKIGMETMTAADIANKKMILIAGIATIKPTEFYVITVSKYLN